MHYYTNIQRYKDFILAKGVKNGEKYIKRLKYEPTLYIPTNKQTPHKSIAGEYLQSKKFGSPSHARHWKKQYDNTGIDIHGLEQWEYTYIAETYPSDIEFDIKSINILNIDIECECEGGFPEPTVAEERVNAITMKLFGHKETHVIGIDNFDYKNDDPNVIYHKTRHEKELLLEFMRIWDELEPDVVTGWNVETFDIAYLVNRIWKLFDWDTVKKLSPHELITSREWLYMGQKKMISYNISGVAILDYLEMYKKFTYKTRETYRLDHIAEVELGKRKIDYSEFGAMHLFYRNDYQKFLDYNIRDTELVEQLDDKLQLMELVITMAYQAKCNYEDVFGSVRYWDLIIYNFLKKRGMVPPPKKLSQDSRIVGAYVKEPQVGQHKWVMSFDLNSLYPHLIMQYNMSPDTYQRKIFNQDISVAKLLEGEVDTSMLTNTTVTPNGALFRTDKQGFLPELLEEMYDQRVLFKNKMIEKQKELETIDKNDLVKRKECEYEIVKYNNNQMVRKISLNSCYGALGNQYFRYFNREIAEGITTSGQLSIKWVERAVNQFLNKLLETDKDYVVAIDTDSIYVTFEDLVERVKPKNPVDFLDTIAKEKLEPMINSNYEELSSYMNAYQNKMEMGREVIADKGIWTAKKRYILNVHDSEGVRYNTPKLKMMGIETAKSSTPMWCRKKLEEGIRTLMNGTENDVHEFIESSRLEFSKLPIEEVSFPRGVSDIKKYYNAASIYNKGTPIHVRGSLLYNNYLYKYNIDKKYPVIQNGEKIKFCYMKLPNIMNENVISFVSALPKEFELEQYIDYDLQFQKSFVEPLGVILDKIGWTTEPVSTLELFFG
jgi:DNA polymerase elongation subunit (family B)